MKHEFTDSEITVAADQAVDTASYYRTIPIDYLKAFLDALPEPQDEWEECAFEDIQKGDRVRLVQVGRTTDFDSPVIETHPTHLVLRDNTQCSNFHKAIYYRIPAPVVHPDPLHDLVILVHGAYGNHYNNPTAYTSDGSAYNIVGLGDTRILPEDITEWEPGTVVPKEVKDNENL